ncbi:hypothetical protein [Thiorhodovibrio frisius]|uniref:Uncharacterized protein n=1 Tax=Thiorhodovibrio frisius TaxID=631362 RepID=H8Z7C1_9GAMM|nr:hypothetical protein [Thiorhodovibrio frisius]EIC19837.1 hypothetical protein Thi970DRAFT_03441 [Thiorhodovibrio frisius]WPL20565.1 hypothetical protein Thiofri_00664 [Thiorhodovibrio frisius]
MKNLSSYIAVALTVAFGCAQAEQLTTKQTLSLFDGMESSSAIELTNGYCMEIDGDSIVNISKCRIVRHTDCGIDIGECGSTLNVFNSDGKLQKSFEEQQDIWFKVSNGKDYDEVKIEKDQIFYRECFRDVDNGYDAFCFSLLPPDLNY